MQWAGEGKAIGGVITRKSPCCVAASLFVIRGTRRGPGGKLLTSVMKRVVVDKRGICLSFAFEPYSLWGPCSLTWRLGLKEDPCSRLAEFGGPCALGCASQAAASDWPCRTGPRIKWRERWRNKTQCLHKVCKPRPKAL